MKGFLKSVVTASSLLAVMALVGCGETKSNDITPKPENNNERPATLTEETDESIINELKVVNAEGVYGNVYLAESVGDKKVSWWSSDPKTIRPKSSGMVSPGEVIRGNEDKTVELIATIGEGETATQYTQNVTVKKAPAEIEDDDYEAYLFCHFVGESYGKTENNVKIATGEQMFFALADVGQGLKFKDMNGSTMSDLKPVLSSTVGERGVRDPYICRSPEGDTFYLIATDLSVYTRGGWGNNNGSGKFTITGSHCITLWESHDLVNWTEGRLIEVAREDAGMAWAPEMIYNDETGEYVIFFSSTILTDSKDAIKERDCIYYTTTRDFVHFGETKKFLKNQPYPEGQEDPQKAQDSPVAINNNERKIIDASVMKIGDYYYCAAKDGDNHENNGGILIQRTQDLLDIDSWEKVMNLADVGFQAEGRNADNKCLEGPEWFYLNKADRKDENQEEIGLMADFYANTSIGYIPWTTTDIEDTKNENNSWNRLTSSEFSWDKQTKRHGTILRITAEEAELLKDNFPIA
ncbi:MAG: glycoside hydrolase family 43 protein [Bacilli bacterium]|nr:glycoside hydrolase family 43 protein [Bacilli bacterium]